MILHTKLELDRQANIKSQKSNYNPPKQVKTLTQQVLKDFQQG